MNRFYLYSGFQKKHYANHYNGNRDILDHLTCNSKWPVCLLDFTYKNRIPEYFAFSISTSKIKIIDDYFCNKEEGK